MKAYLQKDINGNWELIKSSRPIPGGLEVPSDPLTNAYEELIWLQVEALEQPDGSLKNVVTINAVKKAQVIAQRKSDSDEEAEENEKAKDLSNQLKRDLNGFDKDAVVGLEQIQDTLDSVIKFLKDKFDFTEEE